MSRERAVADLTIADVVRGIGIPVEQWNGNCYAIACAMLRAKLVRGRPAYGHWLGRVHPKSSFASKRGLPFVRHGWIVLDERGAHGQRPGRVLDPTRWVFEAVEPYLYIGAPPDGELECEECGYTRDEHADDQDPPTCAEFTGPDDWPYDEGGDRFRQATQQPMPARKDGDKVYRLALPRKLKERLKLPQRLTLDQMHWVATLPYCVMGRDAWAICSALDAAGHKQFVPMDTWIRADAERGL